MGLFTRKPNIEKLKTEKNVEELVKALEHKDLSVRNEAIHALGELGDRRTLVPLIAALKSCNFKDSNDSATYRICLAFGNIRRRLCVKGGVTEPLINSEKDVETLMEVLEARSASLWARIEAANILRMSCTLDEERAGLLIDILDQTDIVDIGKDAIDVLGEVGGRIALERLMKVVLDKKNGKPTEPLDWRRAAIRALGRIRNESAVEPLIEAFQDTVFNDVRVEVAQALAKIGDKRAVEPLIEFVVDSRNSLDERSSIASALGPFGDKRAIEPLIQVLHELEKIETRPNFLRLNPRYVNYIASMRDSAAKTLGRIGDEKAYKPLKRLLEIALARDRYYKEAYGVEISVYSSVVNSTKEALEEIQKK